MKQPRIRIDLADKIVLDQLSAKTGESTLRLLHRAVTKLKKELFFEEMNSAYKDIRADKAAWKIEQDERAIFDKSIGDGLNGY